MHLESLFMLRRSVWMEKAKAWEESLMLLPSTWKLFRKFLLNSISCKSRDADFWTEKCWFELPKIWRRSQKFEWKQWMASNEGMAFIVGLTLMMKVHLWRVLQSSVNSSFECSLDTSKFSLAIIGKNFLLWTIIIS